MLPLSQNSHPWSDVSYISGDVSMRLLHLWRCQYAASTSLDMSVCGIYISGYVSMRHLDTHSGELLLLVGVAAFEDPLLQYQS